MSGKISQMGALRVVSRGAWEAKVRKAMELSSGRVPDAAEALGVSTRQLFRWLEEPCFSNVPRATNGAHRDNVPTRE